MGHNTSRHNARIRRIESGLLLEHALCGEKPKPAAVAERLAFAHVPGVSIAVIADGDFAWAMGYGVRENGRPDPVTTETRFQAASISKPTTALAVLRMVNEGRIDLDEDINRYLHSWSLPPNGAWQPRLTLRHLLSHTGGVTVHGFPGYLPDEPIPTLRQILDGTPPTNTSPIRVDTLPGLQHRYSGGGTTIVQQLLIDVLGRPFPVLMRDLVLDPLEMSHSAFTQPPPRSLWPVTATGHRSDGVPLRGKWHVHPELAAAGLWTTPSDLVRLAIAVQKSAAGVSGAFLPHGIARQMLTGQLGADFGIGFFLDGLGEELRFGHSGGNEGFRCLLVAYANQPWGAAVMTNGDGGWLVIEEILRAIAVEYGWPLDPSYQAPPTRRRTVTPVPVGADVLAAYAGTYALRPEIAVKVARQRNILSIQLTGQAAFEVDPIAEATFVGRALNLEITFQRDDRGVVTGLTLKQNDKEIAARKNGTRR